MEEKGSPESQYGVFFLSLGNSPFCSGNWRCDLGSPSREEQGCTLLVLAVWGKIPAPTPD